MHTAVCKWCGKTFTYAKKKRAKSFCCGECRKASQAEDRKQRDKKIQSGTNIELRKLAKEAVEHGMTYGKYVAMLEEQKGVV